MNNQYIYIKRALAKKRKKISFVASAGARKNSTSNLTLQKEAVKHRHEQLQNTILLFQKKK